MTAQTGENMPALLPTEHRGVVEWLGRLPDRADSLRSTSVQEVLAEFAGIDADDHAGLTRPSCSRMTGQYPVGTTIRNTRQLSILSAEQLAVIAENMDVPAVDPGWLGASIVIRGIADFTHLPPSSRLQFDSGATLVVNLRNGPCHLPAKVIDQDAPGKGGAFKAAARDLRGVTAWVEREGPIRVGDGLRLHVPDQRVWKGS